MAGTSEHRPHVAERHADQEGMVKNISLGLNRMRPLYTSCSEHYAQLDRNLQDITSPAGTSDSDSSRRDCSPRFLTLNTLPRMPSTSPIFQKADPTSSPFLRLPTEIRLHIYSLLVLPRHATDLCPSFEKITASTQDYFDYDKKKHGTDLPQSTILSHPTLRIRTVDPTVYKTRYPGGHARATYSIRADRFRARCMETTYHCVNNPRIEENLAIMRCNKQIHAEAAELLYGSYTFDFDTHIESIIPFLSDLSPYSRSCIKSIRVVKRALPYLKEFDKCEWHNALRYVTSSNNNIRLRRLELGVVAGRPGENGWDKVSRYNAGDFELLRGTDGMEWMQYLLEIRDLQEVDVEPVIEHCPPSTSSTAMASYVRFSASVGGGFSEWLKGQLLDTKATARIGGVAA
ncbi:Hypothetical predicted protein [Lecanosticta acicola]|uniref:Uncharacterized protein n=1 Tax=Lecanosticta acicola TaxID=111012 RepID=A0AAI8YVD1_9PEZI|nr:Hypothetical predicted protein [Lecanosticta acicola]